MARKPRAADGLTKQERKFVEHFALHGNGAEAYGHAYPASRKHSPDYRSKKANELLKKGRVKGRAEQLKERASKIVDEKFDISAERVLQELAAIAFQNSSDIFEWGTYERDVYRKNKETGRLEPVLDKDGKQVTETVPFARAKPSSELTRQQKAAILSASETISRTGDRLIEIKMADKVGALKLLGQHLSLFKMGIDANVAGKAGGPIQLVISTAEANL